MKAIAILEATGFDSSNTGWKSRHNSERLKLSLSDYCDIGLCIGKMIYDWARYAEAHQSRYNSLIGDDYVLGPAWQKIGESLRELLNGEIGSFDAGSLDRNIRTFAAQHGVTLE